MDEDEYAEYMAQSVRFSEDNNSARAYFREDGEYNY